MRSAADAAIGILASLASAGLRDWLGHLGGDLGLGGMLLLGLAMGSVLRSVARAAADGPRRPKPSSWDRQ